MSLTGRKVVVIGAGIGGLAVARALALRGADVIVLEQAEAIREVGAGLQISPNGFAVLRALGLGEALRAVAVEGKAVCLRDYRGRDVLQLDISKPGDGGHYFVHRADLIDLLAEGARAAGARLRLLQKVAGITPGPRPSLRMANGAVLGADLVVGADGLHSVLRPAVDGVSEPFFTGQVAWRAVIPWEGQRAGQVHLHMGPHRHLVSYPLRGGRQMNIVAVQERAAWARASWSQQDDPDTLRAAFADFGADAQAMLARVDQVNLWGLFRHPVAARWYGEGTVLLGDAAHPTLPFLAQGACLALEDAWVLGDALAAGGETDQARALASYQARRKSRSSRVVRAAASNARKYHLGFPPLRWAAHTGLRLAGRLAPGAMLRQFDWLYAHDVTGGATKLLK